MIGRKGIGSIVSYILLILLTVVGATIIIGAVMRSIGNSTDNDSASCISIDLKLNSCSIIPLSVVNLFFPEEPGESLLLNVERLPGGGNIKGIKFVVTDTSGNTHVESPVNLKMGEFFDVNTNYSDFQEYDSEYALLRNLSYSPSSVSINAVVGDSETICPATRPPINCVVYSS